MPTVLRNGPLRSYFFGHEPNESPHIHVDHHDRSAKFWLDPIRLARNYGFAAHELRRIEGLIRGNQHHLLEAWHGFFRRQGR
jgi:hypothetical protein